RAALQGPMAKGFDHRRRVRLIDRRAHFTCRFFVACLPRLSTTSKSTLAPSISVDTHAILERRTCARQAHAARVRGGIPRVHNTNWTGLAGFGSMLNEKYFVNKNP